MSTGPGRTPMRRPRPHDSCQCRPRGETANAAHRPNCHPGESHAKAGIHFSSAQICGTSPRPRSLSRPWIPAFAGMIALGFGLERVVLRPMIGRPVIAVVMATIGLAAVLRGTATMAFGAGTRVIDMPVSDEPFHLGPVMLPPVELVGAGVSLVFLAAFTWFFLKSRTGIAMRAVADNQQVSMAMGINVRRYFALAWAMAGVVSALGGVVWGAMLSVDNQLALVGLKVFPVVILGGLDSVMGAVVGGLIVGIVENLAAGYLDPYVGGGTKDFAPYVLMILVLMVRPEGIFGRRRIERV